MLLKKKGVVVDSSQRLEKEGTMIDHKLGNYDRGYNSPTPKIVVGVMVVVNINTMPLNVIKKEVSLWAKNPFGLSKDLGPK